MHDEPFRLFPYQAIVDRPRVKWPNDARVAVWVIPNIEHFHIEIGNAAPDIELIALDGQSRFAIRDRIGQRPLVLIFGSYT